MADDLSNLSVEELEELLVEALRPNTFKYESFLGLTDVIMVKEGHGPYGVLGSGDTTREALLAVFRLKPRSWRGKNDD
jgi:hypothetical protein